MHGFPAGRTNENVWQRLKHDGRGLGKRGSEKLLASQALQCETDTVELPGLNLIIASNGSYVYVYVYICIYAYIYAVILSVLFPFLKIYLLLYLCTL